MKETDELYMKRCLFLAQKGLGATAPNPMVGAVIVVGGEIVAEGWHRQYGGPHAEIDAINNLIDKELLKQATMYVNLEPCSHFGKTPPCANTLVSYGIKKVVIGSADPNPKVNGQGIGILKDAGVEVVTDVLKNECDFLNRRFFTFHQKKRPYIILKWAQTQDGFMDILRPDPDKNYKYWITNDELRTLSHKWRSEESAILIGYNTFKNDNPQLTNRLYSGKNPIPIVLSRDNVKIGDEMYALKSGEDSLSEVLELLHSKSVQSVIVEGGRKTLDSFLDKGLYDEIRVLTGGQKWGAGAVAPSVAAEPDKEFSAGDNRVEIYYR